MLRSFAFIALTVCAAAPAATLQQLSMDQMTQSATAIVRARVTGSSASFTGSAIYTHYKLQIIETWKGFATSEVMLPGGTARGFKQSVSGVPNLQVGSEYVMFLWTSSSTGITHLVGLTQGLFGLTQQADGSMMAGRSEIGETMLDASGASVRDQAVRMNLSDMKSRVGGSLK
ncbi:MAG: hypothetical protein M3N54_14375 [Acidobacteriota bacterium]|nr:hypothetical protein [Acidobacteriota bacterium]